MTATTVGARKLRLSGYDQCRAQPSRYPSPSPTPKSRANGTSSDIFLAMIGPTAMHAIRLSVPSSSQAPIYFLPFLVGSDWPLPASMSAPLPEHLLLSRYSDCGREQHKMPFQRLSRPIEHGTLFRKAGLKHVLHLNRF